MHFTTIIDNHSAVFFLRGTIVLFWMCIFVSTFKLGGLVSIHVFYIQLFTFCSLFHMNMHLLMSSQLKATQVKVLVEANLGAYFLLNKMPPSSS